MGIDAKIIILLPSLLCAGCPGTGFPLAQDLSGADRRLQFPDQGGRDGVGARDSGSAPIVFIGDYDAELRRADKRVDGPRLIKQLQQMHANTYFWLVWHQSTDWDDLREFLPLAEQAQIVVWVYLVPHSETPIGCTECPYSEPYKLDYVKWAQEIAKLSVEHRNLVGYVIDDFAANMMPGRFTAKYVSEMVQAGKTVNSALRFCPLLYYDEINPAIIEELAPSIDGVVAAYPQSADEISRALQLLAATTSAQNAIEISFPSSTGSQSGDHGMIAQQAQVTNPSAARLAFRYSDDYSGPTSGYHFLQVRVDGAVVWEEDVAGLDYGTQDVDLSSAVAGKSQVEISLGVYDRAGVTTFGFKARFSELHVTGLSLKQPDLVADAAWFQQIHGAFGLRFVSLPMRGRIPLIIMPAGERSEYEARYKEPATPERIAARVKMSLGFVSEHKAEGVVTYCLDKREGNPDLAAVAQAYQAFSAAFK